MSRSSNHRRIVVDDVPYTWAVGTGKIRIRPRDLKAPGFDMPRSDGQEITPGLVAAWIRANVPGHPTPPGEEGRKPQPRTPVAAPEPVAVVHPVVRLPGLPEVYALVMVSHWRDHETGERRVSRKVMACYADPGMAKSEAERLSGPVRVLLETARRVEELEQRIRQGSYARERDEYGSWEWRYTVSWEAAGVEARRRLGIPEEMADRLEQVGRACITWEAKILPMMLAGVPDEVLEEAAAA